ncbi:MAG: hypothetical protein ACI8PZ_007536 [Myxococcota bacterium]|jgi:hypothetical protein
MTALGPVSQTLEADLRERVRKHGVVLWLDLDAHYTDVVATLGEERAAGRLPYAVHGYHGSHLELMLAVERLAAGVDKTPMVVHLPGFNEDTVRDTPLLELYAAGVRYRKKLDTLVTDAAAGRVPPAQIAEFRARDALSLGEADAWLAALLDGGGGGLAAHLRAMSLSSVVDDLIAGGFVAGRVRSPADREGVWDQLAVWTGLPADWRDAALPSGHVRPADMAFAVSSWALAVEYVDDLRRTPHDPQLTGIPSLPRSVIDTCRDLAAHLRTHHPTLYKRTADETEGWLETEVRLAKAEDLGKIDTFRFEEVKVMEEALIALDEARWSVVLDWAAARMSGHSFWVRDDALRQNAWHLIQAGAELGRALEQAGPSLDARSLELATERYLAVGSRVDRAHRELEQRRTALLYPQVPGFATLRARLDRLRVEWRNWADEWARDLNTLCARDGFLPPSHLQQRTLFDEVVRPFAQEAGTTAYFVVDAFRFEMGEELCEAIAGTPATTAVLRGRLAELPTVTEVGMNVLAPVAVNGRLRPAVAGRNIKGFASGEFRVYNPDTRQRAMHDRVGGATCPWLTLNEVLSRDSTSLKQAVARANLVVVHSLEIDKAGENGVGTHVFPGVLRDLRAAWRLLREAGVRRFVITADHGFLLLDESARNAQSHGRKIDPKRRHVLTPVGADEANEVRVPLADLGYDGVDGAHLRFPDSTAVFDTGNRKMSFVHGGNSLQERVIPVLTVVHRAAAGGDSLQYAVRAEALDGVAGMHCLSARLEVVAQGALAFGGSREVELGLRVVDDGQVQVELCQVRGNARIAGGAVYVAADETFELFFKLTGPTDGRVDVELLHSGAVADVQPCVVDRRFTVAGTGPRESDAPSPTDTGWLDALPEGGVRQLFEHLAAHGAVTETEAAAILGGARQVRKLARKFEQYAAKAPFVIRIDVVAGVKRYVREGSAR